MITLKYNPLGYEVIHADGRGLLVQSDWDFPGLARTFGGGPACGCRDTDGTVACRHYSASEHIANARRFLDNHVGDTVEDPGYFTEESAS